MADSMKWDDLLTSKRLGHDATEQAPGRSEFQKDHDRIIFSDSFRRLQGKTQVHPLPSNDHVHNRLTHTLEVASVGRSLGEGVGHLLKSASKLPDAVTTTTDVGAIVQAACLAHDIGNPPFGHAGEFAIRAWFSESLRGCRWLMNLDDTTKRDLENFEGNAQGFRVITSLASYFDGGGLRLTAATLSAFQKYPWSSEKGVTLDKVKFGFFASEFEIFEDICVKTGITKDPNGIRRRHPLAHLVEAADDICYAIVDIEDGVELNLVHAEDAETLLRGVCDQDTLSSLASKKGLAPRQRLAWLRAKAVGAMVENVVSTFDEQEAALVDGTIEGSLTDYCSAEVKNTIAAAKKLAHDKIFVASNKTRIELGAYSIIDILLSAITKSVAEISDLKDENRLSFKTQRVRDLMGPNAPAMGEPLDRAVFKAVDYVAGMTDVFASQLAARFGGHIV